MTFLIIIVVLVVLFMIGMRLGKDKTPKEPTPKPIVKPVQKLAPVHVQPKPIKLVKSEDSSELQDTYDSYIEGVESRLPDGTNGYFIGWVAAKANGDEEAFGVYTSDGLHVGYIQQDDREDFLDWCESMRVPCVGYVNMEDDDEIQTSICCAIPTSAKFVNKVISDFTKEEHRYFDINNKIASSNDLIFE